MTSQTPSVSIQGLQLNFGSIEVLKDLDLDVAPGEFLVLLGSSGCGKSTLLNCIAGLLELTDGQIHINGRNVTWAEPSERGIGMVFQSYALYPQMTVEGNMSFGLKNAGMPKDEIKQRVDRAAGILQIEPLLKRKPAALSGGQRQRVAIGRALVRDVDVFLFDEPLSNLDAKLRTDLRVELKRLHNHLQNTMIYVTHDQVEAMTLADRIAVMKGGKIMQLGTPDEIYKSPQNLYVADFIGSPAMNFVDGQLVDGAVQFAGHSLPVAEYAFGSGAPSSRDVVLGVRPENILVGDAASKADLQLRVTVELLEKMGADMLVWSSLADKPFRIRLDGHMQVAAGDTLDIGIKAGTSSLFDAKTETRL